MTRWERIAKLEQAHHLPAGARIKLSMLRHGGYRKLDEERVAQIKRDLTAGMGVVEAARKYGVAQASVSSIKGGRSWSHVPWPEVD